jgi:hypothetical protein
MIDFSLENMIAVKTETSVAMLAVATAYEKKNIYIIIFTLLLPSIIRVPGQSLFGIPSTVIRGPRCLCAAPPWIVPLKLAGRPQIISPNFEGFTH